MSGTRGYSNYRGRGSGWRAALAVVLVLVILGCAGFLFLQRHIVFDETGTPRMEFPWQRQPSSPSPEEPEAPAELTIEEPEIPEEPEAPAALHIYAMDQTPLTAAAWTAFRETLPEDGAVAVTLKDGSGKVYFDAASAIQNARGAGADTGAALSALLAEERHTVARIACFRDPRGANSNVQRLGLKNTGGYIFYDGNNTQWLDPAKPDARAYLCALAAEAAALGFDEILLTDVGYPTVGKLNKIAYGDAPLAENLTLFLEEMGAALAPYDVTLSVETMGSVLTGTEDPSGLTAEVLTGRVDRVYVPAEDLPESAGELALVPEYTVLPAQAPEQYLLLAP